MPAAWKLKMSLVIEWLYLLRERRDLDVELQAALHGAKIKNRRKTRALKPKPQAASSLAGLKDGQAFGVKRITVSKEELAKRQKSDGKSN